MLQSCKNLRFSLEAPEKFRIGKTGLDDLERDCTPGLLLFRFVHGAHAAFANQPDDPVTPNGLRQPA